LLIDVWLGPIIIRLGSPYSQLGRAGESAGGCGSGVR
jgi:hypothetical protein